MFGSRRDIGRVEESLRRNNEEVMFTFALVTALLFSPNELHGFDQNKRTIVVMQILCLSPSTMMIPISVELDQLVCYYREDRPSECITRPWRVYKPDF